MVIRYHLICIALLISVIGSSDQGTKNVKRSLGFSQSNETEKSDTYDSAYVEKVEVKNCLYMLVSSCFIIFQQRLGLEKNEGLTPNYSVMFQLTYVDHYCIASTCLIVYMLLIYF